ncbi:MAG: MarC family NAAT transporter [Planctomycetota bacterium]|jgi:multiple antibiotic resistance protein
MSSIGLFGELVLATVLALLPVTNPPASAPAFLAMTERMTPARRLGQLRAACCFMAGILITFLVAGSLIMRFFGISIPGLRIAGGLMVAGIGSSMLTGAADRRPTEAGDETPENDRDIAFSPLAMPMLSGPGSIAVTLGLTSLAKTWIDYVAIAIGIVAVAVIAYATLRVSGSIVAVIGRTGMNALTKVMGFLLLCIGIQFIVNGVLGIATDPAIVRSIRDAAGP